MHEIQIQINGEVLKLAPLTSIRQLLEQRNISPLGLAVAINQQVIPKSAWNETFLEHQQDIMLIRATQGG